MLKDSGKTKPEKKVKIKKCKNCKIRFELNNENAETIGKKTLYVCPICGFENKK